MDLSQLRELLKIVAESDVAEVEIEEDGLKVVVRKSGPSLLVQPPPFFPSYGMGYPPMGYPAPAPQAGPAPLSAPPAAANGNGAPTPQAPAAEEKKPGSHEVIIRAPIVGTFYRASSPESASFVEVGDTVNPGDVLCIIEAMKLMNEIECEEGGTIRQILVQNAEAVEYDQPLFVLEKAH